MSQPGGGPDTADCNGGIVSTSIGPVTSLPADYSAFGSTDPLYDRAGDRIRWFCPWYISDQVDLARMLDAVAGLERRESPGRVTIRVVSRGDLSPQVGQLLGATGFQVEATMPLGDASDRIVTYIARLRPSRRSSPADSSSEQALLAQINAGPRKGAAAIREEFHQLGGFQVEQVGPGTLSTADIDRLIGMHRATFPTFPYEFEHKLALMLAAPDEYLISQVRSVGNGRIYAFSNLEINTVPLADGSDLRLAEYDNSMRAANCPELGELKSLGAILRLELALRARDCGVDLCHAESRASLGAINRISYDLGMNFGGTLEQHLLISGPSDVNYQNPSRLESMNVWYLNRVQLAALEKSPAC